MQVRTGIFGGSFNPVHLGHTGLASYIVGQGLVDEVWLMVSPCNPLKHLGTLVSETDRLCMVRLAVKDLPGIEASDFEFSMPRPSYTAYTLRMLERTYSDRSFTLIIGSDNWEIFHLWREYEYILRRYPLIVYPRGGRREHMAIADVAAAFGVRHISAPEFPFSSTQVREALYALKSDAGAMLAPEVLDYIRTNGLYT